MNNNKIYRKSTYTVIHNIFYIVYIGYCIIITQRKKNWISLCSVHLIPNVGKSSINKTVCISLSKFELLGNLKPGIQIFISF